MYAQAAIKPNPLLRNGAYGIVMRGVQKCTRGCSSLRDRKKLSLCCIKLDTATDPACGSGNFLTETYVSLRRLENEILRELQGGQVAFGDTNWNPIKVSIAQFYGIEINDFACDVAKAALWIAESQMMKETEDIVLMQLDFLPLKSYANIIEANALRIDWETVVPKEKLNYIMGNPPYAGYKFQSKTQKDEIEFVAKEFKNYGTLDYVSSWFIKTSKFIRDTEILAAFVATNSICQGEHVTTLWKPIFNIGISIVFAYCSFKWDSEAAVNCIIVGIGNSKYDKQKRIWNASGICKVANYINGYLLDTENIFIEKRNKPWFTDTPIATKGNAAMDNGNLTFTNVERDRILSQEPTLYDVIKRYMSADDFLNNRFNYCFWFYNVNITEYRHSKEVQRRLQAVKEYRENSNRLATKKMAEYPMLFAEIRQPISNYIMMPVVSSEKRKYVPIAFLPPEIINSYASISIPNANLYHFGVLTSNIHNSWMRAICGRLKSDYRYATSLVYNTFPWPMPTENQKAKIENTAQGILDARNLYPDSSLADLYDPLTMPPELLKAHQANDKAVMEAYGLSVKDTSEADCVAFLMKRYQELTTK